MRTFTVYRDSESFGAAQIKREGLYYRIQIRCPKGGRVTVLGPKGMRDLGICVPSDGSFVIQTQVPVKALGEGDLFFSIASEKLSFYPVEANKPFARLDIVRECVMSVQNGQIGVQMDISKPTGQ